MEATNKCPITQTTPENRRHDAMTVASQGTTNINVAKSRERSTGKRTLGRNKKKSKRVDVQIKLRQIATIEPTKQLGVYGRKNAITSTNGRKTC